MLVALQGQTYSTPLQPDTHWASRKFTRGLRHHSVQNARCRAVIRAKPIRNFAIILHVKYRQIRILPRSRCCPCGSAMRSAHAPLMVAAATASAGDIFMCVHANDIAIGMLIVGEVPWVVIRRQRHRHTGIDQPPCIRIFLPCPENNLRPGTSVATVSALQPTAMTSSLLT
jgi:hypothetical protein